jgi:hypothetical protein
LTIQVALINSKTTDNKHEREMYAESSAYILGLFWVIEKIRKRGEQKNLKTSEGSWRAFDQVVRVSSPWRI